MDRIEGIEVSDATGVTGTTTELSLQESVLNDSRITTTGNGNLSSKPFCSQPTNGQKWWAAVILGFVFALVSSPPAYNVTSTVTKYIADVSLTQGPGPTLLGLFIHTLIFIVIVRLILW